MESGSALVYSCSALEDWDHVLQMKNYENCFLDCANIYTVSEIKLVNAGVIDNEPVSNGKKVNREKTLRSFNFTLPREEPVSIAL